MADNKNTDSVQTGAGNVAANNPEVIQNTPPKTEEPKVEVPKVEEPVSQALESADGDENVSVPASVLKRLLDRVDTLESKSSLLEAAADQNKLIQIQNMRNAGKLVKSAMVSKLGPLYVMGWKVVRDEVHFEGEKLVETQVVKVFLSDKTEKEMSLREFNTGLTRERGEIIGENKNKDGNITYKMQFNDGREIEIGGAYIN